MENKNINKRNIRDKDTEILSKTKVMTKSEKIKDQKKYNYTDDDDGDGESDYDEHEVESEEEDEEDDFDKKEFTKMLSKIFPSKYMQKKIEKNEKKEKNEKNEKKEKKGKKEKNVKILKKKKKNEVIEYEDEEEDEITDVPKLNIYFTFGNNHEEEYYDDEYDEDYDDDDYEDDEDSDEDSDEDYEDEEDEEDEETDEDEEYEDEDEEEEEEDNGKKKRKAFNLMLRGKTIKKSKDDEEEEEDETDEEEIKTKKSKNKKRAEEELNNELEMSKQILKEAEERQKTLKSSTLEKTIITCKKEIKQLEKEKQNLHKKDKEKNVQKFRKIMTNKNVMNDYDVFKKLSLIEQNKIINEAIEVNKITQIEKPYRLSVLESDIPHNFKACALKKINMLRYMEPGAGEFYKVRNWVDTFMKIPFNKFSTLPISRGDGLEKCHDFMEKSKNILDSAVHGLNDAKMQIMQFVGQWITNPSAIGSAIAIKGPMGTGKTTLVKEGISKILGRDFAFIALGGATDSSFLEGHSYTYEGSSWGQIVEILIKSKTMNPVIYFDELDKISDTPKGEEITGILTHLTDTAQNNQFHDKYFSEIDFDLSKCLFIFSYNDESKINPILRDRMYRIETKGYDSKQKTTISKDYLMPKIREQVCFDKEDIIIDDETLSYIIEQYTDKEQGVRNLKRCLEIIHTKLNLYRLMKPETNLFEEDMTLKVEFPFTLNKEIVGKLIKKGSNKDFLNTLYV